MKSTLKLLAIFFAISTIIFDVTAHDVSFIQPSIPANSWEQHPEGIALAMILTTKIENNLQKSTIQIYIKNTSDTVKSFSRHSIDWGIEIFYIDDHGAQVPLHDYSEKKAGIDSMRLTNLSINPEATLLVPIDITREEMTLLKSHPVKCSFVIDNSITKQKYTIESSPKVLTETASDAAGK